VVHDKFEALEASPIKSQSNQEFSANEVADQGSLEIDEPMTAPIKSPYADFLESVEDPDSNLDQICFLT